MENLELTEAEIEELSGLPGEYWACPLCLITLLEAYAQGTIHHEKAFKALKASDLVEDWPGNQGRVRTTERGKKFIDMLLETPLPEQRWIDPRNPAAPAESR
jgi:hypothetical protein